MAERLHIGQPPLSQQIQALEAELGAQLFERNKRSVRLTQAGKLFLDDARRILALSEQAAVTARRAQRGEAGELRIGFLRFPRSRRISPPSSTATASSFHTSP